MKLVRDKIESISKNPSTCFHRIDSEDPVLLHFHMEKIEEEVDEFIHELVHHDLDAAAVEACDVLEAVVGSFMYRFDMTRDETLTIIHRNLQSKFIARGGFINLIYTSDQ